MSDDLRDLKVRMIANGESAETTLGHIQDTADAIAAAARRRSRGTAPEFDRGLGPTSAYPVPGPELFVDTASGREDEFIEAPDLEELAADLIDEHDLAIDGVPINFLWKAEGGASKGKATQGKCVKTSGLTRFYGGAIYTIWLAADYCRLWEYSLHQVSALLYHELLHVDVGTTDKGEVKYSTRPHDVEVFREELEAYGLWDTALQQTFKQLEFGGL